LIIAIVSFSSVASIGESDMIDEWAGLTELDKLHFDNDIGKLVSTNKVNASLHAIYNVILAGLFALKTCTMQALYAALPDNWAKPVYSKISFQQGIFYLFIFLKLGRSFSKSASAREETTSNGSYYRKQVCFQLKKEINSDTGINKGNNYYVFI
jgi:hypothetical protein